MKKINFVNKPDTSTPVNASNLNEMQDNIETAIEEAITESGENTEEINKNTTDYVNKCKTITLNNEWRNAFKSYGNNLAVEMPLFNPNNVKPTANLTATIFFNGSWQSISNVTVSAYNTNQVLLQLVNNLSLVDGSCYLVRLNGTITTT